MPFDVHGALLVAVVAGVTALIRFLPFVVFGGGRPTPRFIVYLAGVLPCAIMAMLVVYCLKRVSFASPAGWAPQLISAAAVAARRSGKSGLGTPLGNEPSGSICRQVKSKGRFFVSSRSTRPAQPLPASVTILSGLRPGAVTSCSAPL